MQIYFCNEIEYMCQTLQMPIHTPKTWDEFRQNFCKFLTVAGIVHTDSQELLKILEYDEE
jgi:hypothetical protein